MLNLFKFGCLQYQNNRNGERGNVCQDSRECCHFNIPPNAEEDSGECLKRFREMFKNILEDVWEDSRECWRKFYATTYKSFPKFKYCFSSTFFASVAYFLLPFLFRFYFLSLFMLEKRWNSCAPGQGYQKTLNNSQLKGLKHTLDRAGAINLILQKKAI